MTGRVLPKAADPRMAVFNAMSEKEWMAQIIAWAKRGGWLAYHTWRSVRSEPGFPDLVLCKPPRILFVEAKREHGFISQPQAVWLAALRASAGVEVFVWRPSDGDAAKGVLLA